MNYNLNNHEAFGILKDYGVVPAMVTDLMYEDGELKKYYAFRDFSEAIDPAAKELFLAIYCDNNEKYRNLACVNPNDETADDVKIIQSKIKGDLFEIFVMFTLQYFQPNTGVGIEIGTYEQVPDETDKGLDFSGKHFTTDKRIFGQIKYRNPLIKDPKFQIAFTCTELNKLFGEAGDTKDFDKKVDLLMLVCNTPVFNAFHYELKNRIGWTGTLCDEHHRYIKIVDQHSFEAMIGYGSKKFWETFAKQFE